MLTISSLSSSSHYRHQNHRHEVYNYISSLSWLTFILMSVLMGKISCYQMPQAITSTITPSKNSVVHPTSITTNSYNTPSSWRERKQQTQQQRHYHRYQKMIHHMYNPIHQVNVQNNHTKKHNVHCRNRMKLYKEENDPNENEKIRVTSPPNSSTPTTQRSLDVFILTFPHLYAIEKQKEQAKIEDASKNTSKAPTNKEINQKVPKYMKLLKRWKYYVLGDGGVYFDQRPKTLLKLNQYFLDEIVKSKTKAVEAKAETETTATTATIITTTKKNAQKMEIECAVISTCKRFEILITIESIGDVDDSRSENINDQQKYRINEIKNIIASSIAKQILHQRRKLNLYNILPFLTIPWDKPSRIRKTKIQQRQVLLYDEIKQNIEEEIKIVDGIPNVAKRLTYLSSGLLDRPLFRPFSSRDSHIMFQIKRTSDGSQRYSYSCNYQYTPNYENELIAMQDDAHFYGLNSSTDDHFHESMTQKKVVHNDRDVVIVHKSNTTKYTKLFFDTALQGGKAARSPKVVPILNQLKDESNGADGPVDLSTRAAEDAKQFALRPILTSCFERLKAMEATDLIVALQNDAKMIASQKGIDMDEESDDDKTEKRRIVRQILHDPIINLRQGNSIDVDAILREIDDKTNIK